MSNDFDNDIRNLFIGYDPEIEDDEKFLLMFDKNIKTVDTIREEMKLKRKATVTAAIAAGVTGFVCGILSTFLFPVIERMIGGMLTVGTTAYSYFEAYGTGTIWSALCVLTISLSYFAYDLTSAFSMKNNYSDASL